MPSKRAAAKAAEVKMAAPASEYILVNRNPARNATSILFSNFKRGKSAPSCWGWILSLSPLFPSLTPTIPPTHIPYISHYTVAITKSRRTVDTTIPYHNELAQLSSKHLQKIENSDKPTNRRNPNTLGANDFLFQLSDKEDRTRILKEAAQILSDRER